jgi:PAS domain-containing protein
MTSFYANPQIVRPIHLLQSGLLCGPRRTIHQFSILQAYHAVEIFGVPIFVRDHHDGLASLPVDLLEEFQNHPRVLGIQVCAGFVCKEDIGSIHDCPRDGDALLLPTRELGLQVIPPFQEPDGVQYLPCRCNILLLFSIPAEHRWEADVLLHRKFGDQRVALEDIAELVEAEHSPLPVGEGAYIDPIDVDGAAPIYEGDRIVGFRGILIDLTRQKEAEAALRRERDFIDATLHALNALVLVLDRDGRIVRSNHACEVLTGYNEAEVKGQVLWDLFILPEEAAGVKKVFATLGSRLRHPGGAQQLLADPQRR